VACTWLVLAAVLRGLGHLVRLALGKADSRTGDWHAEAWMGWAASIVFLQIWHMFLPVDRRALNVVCAAGVTGCAVLAVVGRRGPARNLGPMPVWMLIFALTAFWLANHSVRQPAIRDSGLYHLNAVRWAAEYPVVPGLGNLHGRLAFNNSFFLYAAMLDVGPFAHKSHQLASGLLMLLVVWRCLQGAAHVALRKTQDNMELYYALFLAPVVTWCVTSGYASSPSPDTAIYLLAVVAGGFLVAWESGDEQGAQSVYGLTWVAILAAAGVTVKLTFAVFAAALLIAVSFRRWGRESANRPPAIIVPLIAMLLALLPWMARGVIMSGYPFYPMARFGFPVEWRIDEHALITQSEWIRSWARNPALTPAETLGAWSWVWTWVKRVAAERTFNVVVPCALVLAGLAIRRFRKLPDAATGRQLRIAVAVPAVCLVAWFFSAPDPRFAGSFFWVLCILVLAGSLTGIDREGLRISLLLYSTVILAQNVDPIRFLRPWNDPGVAHVAEVEARTTDSGLTVWVPKEGDLCWDAPLPCTPYFSRILELRDPTDMSKGFKKRRAQRTLED